jgi:hypothetical protein
MRANGGQTESTTKMPTLAKYSISMGTFVDSRRLIYLFADFRERERRQAEDAI